LGDTSRVLKESLTVKPAPKTESEGTEIIEIRAVLRDKKASACISSVMSKYSKWQCTVR
jgi:hypothetical protein